MNYFVELWNGFEVMQVITPLILEKGIFLFLLYLSYKPVKLLTTKFFNKILELRKIELLLKEFIIILIEGIIIIFYTLNIVHILGVETTTLVAMIGSVGIGVGLALKGSLSDLAGGIQILVSKYFVKGNFINVAGIEGTVQRITLLYTVLYTPDNKVIIVPNGKLSSGVITNVTGNDIRRVDFVFSTSYESNPAKVREILLDIFSKHPLVLQDKEIFIKLSKLNSSSLDFTVRVWTRRETYRDVLFDLPEIVKVRFDEEKIEIPYNKLDIYQRNESQK
ncbi:MAG: mechanosensitive ion channel family protein [Cetobacterium sp.]|uniref:mechanosensitive ion channel family protein n=1 Tax=Cetobacterium sp. TaxID=2071632 RepID=UPI003F39824E